MMRSSRVLLLLVLIAGCSHREKPLGRETSATSQNQQTDRPGAPEHDSSGAIIPASAVHLAGAKLDPKRAMINGLGMGSLLEDVRLQLGSPNGTQGPTYEAATGDTTLIWLYSGLRVTFSDRRVVGISCTDQRCLTAGGIRIGSTPAEVARVYGAFESSSLPDGSTIFYPFSTDQSCSLAFEFKRGGVSEINLSCPLN